MKISWIFCLLGRGCWLRLRILGSIAFDSLLVNLFLYNEFFRENQGNRSRQERRANLLDKES